MTEQTTYGLTCPIPLNTYPVVTMAHGSGGSLMRDLIDKMFRAGFDNPVLDELHDGAVLDSVSQNLAFTTDSYVVNPIFFAGGDIGILAVCGTVNDLAMCGARPLYLSCSVILEEGFPMEDLWRLVQSMKRAADDAGVRLVTGDTKVVERGKGDGIYINTSGVGAVFDAADVHPRRVGPGDVIISSGDVGRHGIAVMSAREGFVFDTEVQSDVACVSPSVNALFDAGVDVHCLRDLTRGGLASACVEIAQSAGIDIELEERAIEVSPGVKSACEILGFDPLYVANEGRFIVVVAEHDVPTALKCLTGRLDGVVPSVIGRVSGTSNGSVSLKTVLDSLRSVDLLSGEQMPRIC